MTHNVLEFTGVTVLDTPPSKVLEHASNANLQDVVVVGWDENGNLYFNSSSSDGAEVNWLLDSAKQELLEAGRK